MKEEGVYGQPLKHQHMVEVGLHFYAKLHDQAEELGLIVHVIFLHSIRLSLIILNLTKPLVSAVFAFLYQLTTTFLRAKDPINRMIHKVLKKSLTIVPTTYANPIDETKLSMKKPPASRNLFLRWLLP